MCTPGLFNYMEVRGFIDSFPVSLYFSELMLESCFVGAKFSETVLVPSEGHGPPGGGTDLSQTIQQRRMQNNRHVHRWTRGPWQQKCASDAENHIFYFKCWHWNKEQHEI